MSAGPCSSPSMLVGSDPPRLRRGINALFVALGCRRRSEACSANGPVSCSGCRGCGSGSATRAGTISSSAASGSICSSQGSSSGSSCCGERWGRRAAIPSVGELANFFLIAAAAIPVFYLPALFFGSTTNYTIVDAWRFWIIHLWVEGFFEFFVTVIVAAILLRARPRRAPDRSPSYLSRCHSLFRWRASSGRGTIGTSPARRSSTWHFQPGFSVLEVVPLTLLTLDAWDFSNYPPAEPGALFSVSRSKRLEGDADASPAHCAT